MKQGADIEDRKEIWEWAVEKEWEWNREEDCELVTETIELCLKWEWVEVIYLMDVENLKTPMS